MLWKGAVEKPVENVEKYEFSTATPENPNSKIGGKHRKREAYNRITPSVF